MNQLNTFINVIVPIPIPQLYTYAVPDHLTDEVEIGKRVIVEFGRRKLYSCVIAETNVASPDAYEAKQILEVMDGLPILNTIQLELVTWIADYYMCAPGEVINAALPSGLKLSSESKIQLHPHFHKADYDVALVDPSEGVLMQHLWNDEALKLQDLPKITGIKSPHRFIQSLIKREFVILYEEISEKYQPKTVRKVRLTADFMNETALSSLFEKLEKKPTQSNALLTFLREVPMLENPGLNISGIPKKQLIDFGVSGSSIQTLIKNGVLEEFDDEISRFAYTEQKEVNIQLSSCQQKAYREIIDSFERKTPALLHGVTGSGKTELYIKLIQEVLHQGQQVLYLLPEIALTHQIVERLMGIFGDSLGVYHSRFSDAERVEVWNNIQSGRFSVIIGVRSSIFLPFDDLGLIIIDEEHDASYKQQDPSPRYHARDVAMVLAQKHQAKVLLGSATPSLETYHNARHAKYTLVQLKERYLDAKLPHINIIDLKEERRKNTLKGLFSGHLIQEIGGSLQRKEQVILFQNRRGYSPTIQCETCFWIPKCIRCDISLTLHQYKHELNCHYCGYKEKSPVACPACGSTHLTSVGFGTEKVEEEIKIYFPDATVDRMDMETTRSRKNLDGILHRMENNETNILVGTQMVTKGLDFDNVTLVGILNADNMIHFPDYRSSERAFQSMLQVGGRAGRKTKPGKVILQTYAPELNMLKQVTAHDYEGFYNDEVLERQRLSYPPFSRLITIVVKHKQVYKAENAGRDLGIALRKYLGNERILGPSVPSVSRIRNYYHFELLVKLERDKLKLNEVKKIILHQVDIIKGNPDYSGMRVVLNADPL